MGKIYLWDLQLKPLGPFAIGTKGYTSVKAALKLGDRYVIPASSWKGALRALATSCAPRQGLSPLGMKLAFGHRFYRDSGRAFYHAEQDAPQEVLAAVEGALREVARGRKVKDALPSEVSYIFSPDELYTDQERIRRELVLALSHIACPIDMLFGSQYAKGLINIADTVVPVSASQELRPHVGIDRISRVAKSDLLYTEELVRAGSVRLRATLWVPDEREVLGVRVKGEDALAVWLGTLECIRALGIRIGSGKSRGNGLLMLDEGASRCAVLGGEAGFRAEWMPLSSCDLK